MFRDPKVIFREFGIQMKSEDIKKHFESLER